MNYKLAIVGSAEAIAGFALLGAETVPANNPDEAVEHLFRLKRDMQTDENGVERNKYAIVFITEDLASALSPDDEKKLARGALPAIIPLPAHHSHGEGGPSHQGSTGYGLQRLKRIVERAVGSDILQ